MFHVPWPSCDTERSLMGIEVMGLRCVGMHVQGGWRSMRPVNIICVIGRRNSARMARGGPLPGQELFCLKRCPQGVAPSPSAVLSTYGVIWPDGLFLGLKRPTTLEWIACAESVFAPITSGGTPRRRF